MFIINFLNLFDKTKGQCYNIPAKGEDMKKKETAKAFSKDMTIGEVLRKNPNLEEVFMGFGMHCVSCPVSQMETVEEAAQVHGVDVDFLLKKLNKYKD